MVSYGGAEEILEETKLGVLYLGNFRADGKLQYVIRDVVLMRMPTLHDLDLDLHIDLACMNQHQTSSRGNHRDS